MSENGSDRVHEVANSSAGPTDARARICPQCRSADLLALGHILADNTGVRGSYRCRACATEFLLFHTERRPRTAGSAGDELTAPGLLPAISTCRGAATT
jgi:hypothetical protein